MESVAGSVSRPGFVETSRSLQSSASSCRASSCFLGFAKIARAADCFNHGCSIYNCDHGFRLRASGFPVRAVAKETNDSGADQGMPESLFSLASEDDSTQLGSQARSGETLVTTVPVVGGASGGSRSGLFRTPISGGVQSATSVHDLPRPALAVRNLMEQARFAHLCTLMSRMHHQREGYPFGSLVDFASDSMGHPIFSFSPLAIHTRNLLVDPRCTLVVQAPGWSGLSNARVTIFGDVYPLPADKQEWAHQHYTAKHYQGASQQWGNLYYYRMESISDIYFIGGFGTVAWVDVKEYETIHPDKIAVNGGEQNLKELNAMFSKPLKELLSSETEIDDAALISIDSKGTDVRVRQGTQFNVQRIPFEVGHAVETLEEAKAALQKLLDRGSGMNLLNYQS
ncbi:uncharacterized protein LOC116263734 isoform X2 [Nymphaea colorata]|uniref:uncharacterized protein LOC116263734 isoform X2 n=1 Tax=Nymphaea colorata TaxID=210225 RepID=UPI00129E3975|nr:uncharacterized protein LOC116263734 isoform X2 [Nymphaea colorata]